MLVFLKRLEIQGFKSFADKVALEMKPGIIVVVGPNGSGKSNIADAIRWVLGEQSAKSLRGGKMEDIIFAGSDKRRSLGMAEVSLTIDNTSGSFPLEFNEITVTRRLYRSGESDFLINKVPCRLKDIHELFMDTGVGREGISIIGQGKIDEILAMKPEERRGVLEEAAGIVKYRHRKKEAVRKLDDTEASLVRLNDIITELTDQEDTLAEQARVAEIYQGLKSELDAQEIGLIVNELNYNSDKLTKIKTNRSQYEAELQEIRAKYLAVQSREEELKLALEQLDEKLVQKQEEVYAENLRLEKNAGEKKVILERITELNRQAENNKLEISRIITEQQLAQEELANHQQSGGSLLTQLAEQKKVLQEYEIQLEEESFHDQKLTEQLEALKSEHFDALQEETKLNNEFNSQKQRIIQLERQEEQNKQKISETEDLIKEVAQKSFEITREMVSLEQQKADLEAKINETEDRILAQEDVLQKVQQHKHSISLQKNNLAAKHKALEDLEKEGQGYGEGVKELLSQKSQGKMPGIIGTVAQVITVPKEYELALEVTLGGTLQHLLVENDKVAQDAIQWLKKNNKGRVTLLPLNTVKGSKAVNNIPQGDGVIGCFADLIEYDAQYRGIMEYILGRVFLVQNLSTAVKQAKATGFKYRMVTLDGQLVNAGGSLTGGSRKAQPNGILSRRRNILELEESLAKITEELQAIEDKEREEHSILSQYKKEINLYNQQVQDIIIKKAENSKTTERWQAENERLTFELENLNFLQEELRKEREVLERNIQRFAKETELLKERISNSEASIKEMTEKAKIIRLERLKKNERLTTLRIEVATIEEKVTSFKKEEQHYIQRVKQLKEQQVLKEEEQVKIAARRVELQEEEQHLEAVREQDILKLQEMEKHLEELKHNKQILSEDISQVSQDVKKYSAELNEKENKIHQYDLQLSKFETAIEAAERRLREQYEMEASIALEKHAPVFDRKYASQRIHELKEQIAALGQVNLGAVEEYKKLTERLSFLATQVEDMTEAKERLLKVIREMDDIMSQRFQETFQLVDQSFREMFNRLFGGGRAQLQLTDPENLLETGVEIMAQPPGKKTQYLSLLSGGEKALTGISLLMAILNVKPSPFCVLDEIEANLDEANVLRFAQALQEFAEKTQFIVISHHKGTMEVAHLLYGVTIEENGVSQLVSVKLEDAKSVAS